MLKHSNAMATIAVKDVEAAAEFYEGAAGPGACRQRARHADPRSGDSTVMSLSIGLRGHQQGERRPPGA